MIGTSVMKELRGHRGRRYIDPTEPLILKTLTLHYKQSLDVAINNTYSEFKSCYVLYTCETLKMKMYDKEITG